MSELGHAKAVGLERALVEHVGLCWLQLQVAEARYTKAMTKDKPLALALGWERLITAAQARYLRATESLARVRRLLRSAGSLQVNIATCGGQQVNVNHVTKEGGNPQ
jgi:hypothetical protein